MMNIIIATGQYWINGKFYNQIKNDENLKKFLKFQNVT